MRRDPGPSDICHTRSQVKFYTPHPHSDEPWEEVAFTVTTRRTRTRLCFLIHIPPDSLES